MVKKRGKESNAIFSSGLSTMDNGSMIWKMVMGIKLRLMDLTTKESSKMVSSMEKVLISTVNSILSIHRYMKMGIWRRESR